MNGKLAAIGGLTIGAMTGAVTMYFLDPNRGGSRRTSVVDHTTELTRLGRKAAGKTLRNVGHRISGLRQSLRSWTGKSGLGSGPRPGARPSSSKSGRAARRLKIA